MSASSVSQPESTLYAAPEVLGIRYWPLVDRPWLALATGGLIAGLAYFCYARFGSLAVAIGGMVTLVASTPQIWLPVYFDVGPAGIARTQLGRRSRMSWQLLDRYRVHPRGVVLVPCGRQGAWRLMRAAYIPFGNQRDEILAVFEF